MSTEERNEFGQKISQGRLSMSIKDKQLRAERMRESFKKSTKHKEYVERMKTERNGAGNPASVIVHWKGEKFLTNKEFQSMMISRGLPLKQCASILEDDSIVDCWVEGQSKKLEPITCPHCGKVSKGRKYSAMKRYHFDNCKFKETNENKVNKEN
jgi:hypothetical protein